MEPSVATSTCGKVSVPSKTSFPLLLSKILWLAGGGAMRAPAPANAIAIILFVAHGKTFAWLLACFVRVFGGGVGEGE